MRLTANVVYGPGVSDDGELLRDQISARRARPPTLWGYLSQLTAAAGWTSLPWLHRVKSPTLIMSGAADPIVPPINARILARRIPDAQLEVLEGAGHLLLLSHTGECAAMIAKFLNGDRDT
jgi:pimeloyl-ACP methyl ester carboxylesterase